MLLRGDTRRGQALLDETPHDTFSSLAPRSCNSPGTNLLLILSERLAALIARRLRTAAAAGPRRPVARPPARAAGQRAHPQALGARAAHAPLGVGLPR